MSHTPDADDAYDDYYDAAKKDGEVIQGRHGGQIDLWALVNQINGTKPPAPVWLSLPLLWGCYQPRQPNRRLP